MSEKPELNRPTPQGKLLGESLARICDRQETLKRALFPNHQERCGTCAFRSGTIPNGCPETLLDAVKCVIEGRDFLCHEHVTPDHNPDGTMCAGWWLMMNSKPRTEAPWPFSHEGLGEYLERPDAALPMVDLLAKVL